MEKKTIKLLKITGAGKRGKNPHINHSPEDSGVDNKSHLSTHGKNSHLAHHFKRSPQHGRVFGESVVVTAKTHKGNTVTRRFSDEKTAREHRDQWNKKGKYQRVDMRHESVLEKKAAKYGLPLAILTEVFARGCDHFFDNEEKINEGREVPVDAEQWAFARVNSFLEGGKALQMDIDLVSEDVGYSVHGSTPHHVLATLTNMGMPIAHTALTRDNCVSNKPAVKKPTHPMKPVVATKGGTPAKKSIATRAIGALKSKKFGGTH